MRRVMCLVLFLLVILQGVPGVSAQVDEAALEQEIIDACLYGKAADVSEYAVTYDTFSKVFNRLMESGRMPWFTDYGYSYRYNERTGYLLEFTPESLDPAQYDRTLYEQKLAEVMAACIHEGMTPEQIALSVHDYLILINVYDESLEANTGYDLLVNGTTVCAGYTALYMDILNRAGVPCVSVTSEPMEHTWNLVQLDGQWYHVDVTWDDPTTDIYGRVEHTYFLVTDAEIAVGEKPHHDWVTDITCTSTRYSDAYWRDIHSGIFFESADAAYLLRSGDFTNTVCRRNMATGEETVLHTVKEPTIDIGYGTYTYTHMGLWYRGGRLWYGTLDTLRSMTTDGSDTRTEYTHDVRNNKNFIYGFALRGNTVNITTSDHQGNMASCTAPVETATHLHSYTETQTAPTCEEQGYILSSCSCGISCKSDLTQPLGHDYEETDKKDPTFKKEGHVTEVCRTCDHTQTRTLPVVDPAQWLQENARTVILLAAMVIGIIASVANSKKKAKKR